jgi:two-component system sensor histidine kinase KdpD
VSELASIEREELPSSLRPFETKDKSEAGQYLVASLVVVLVAVVNYFLNPLLGVHASALIFLVGVVVLALFVGRGPTLLAATMSAIIWDYFFLPPIFAFRVTHAEDAILLATFFVVALVLRQLASRTRAQEKAKRQIEARTRALYLLTRELAGAAHLDEMLRSVVQQMEGTFNMEVGVLLADPPERLEPQNHPASRFQFTESERRAAEWTHRHGSSIVDSSGDSSEKGTLCLSLTASQRSLGVIGLRLRGPLSPHQRNLLDSFAKQIALALDRLYLREESNKAKLLAESERLSKTMLNSMSHEIRTPIAVIKNATSNLLDIQETALTAPQQQIVSEIQEANERLDRLVGKALDMTRLESGRVTPKITLCDVSDLVHVAVKETRKELRQHNVTVEIVPDLPLVAMDFVMTLGALTNFLSNAATHTPAKTSVWVNARTENGQLILRVADNGPGIPPDSLPRVFDKFYRCPHAPTGGTGLGLSLVRGFIEAQGGHATAANRNEGGAVFSIYLPLERPGFNNEETGL